LKLEQPEGYRKKWLYAFMQAKRGYWWGSRFNEERKGSITVI